MDGLTEHWTLSRAAGCYRGSVSANMPLRRVYSFDHDVKVPLFQSTPPSQNICLKPTVQRWLYSEHRDKQTMWLFISNEDTETLQSLQWRMHRHADWRNKPVLEKLIKHLIIFIRWGLIEFNILLNVFWTWGNNLRSACKSSLVDILSSSRHPSDLHQITIWNRLQGVHVLQCLRRAVPAKQPVDCGLA